MLAQIEDQRNPSLHRKAGTPRRHRRVSGWSPVVKCERQLSLEGRALRPHRRLSPADRPGSSREVRKPPGGGGVCRGWGVCVGPAAAAGKTRLRTILARARGPGLHGFGVGVFPRAVPSTRHGEEKRGRLSGRPRDVGTRLRPFVCTARARITPVARSACKIRPVPPGQWEGAQDWWSRIRL